VRFGYAIPAYGAGADGGAVADLIEAGEELGFESAWLPDHVALPDYVAESLSAPFLEPLSTCAWALGATRRLRLGTDALVATYRHPLLVAAMAGTLGRLAGDRLILGVCVGWCRGEFEALGVAYDERAARTDEWVQALRSTPAGLTVVDPPTPPPVWIAGNSGSAVRRAALQGDGWHPLWIPPDQYAARRQRILELRGAHELTGEFTFSFSAAMTVFADEPTGGWPPTPARAPVGSEFRYAPEPWVAPDGRPRLCGSPDDLVADIRLLVDAGVEHITMRFGTTDVSPLETFAREVMPAFG
jgi:alkanesulfonate monooxygenase SsuD/methylene tetrahydromethanopterin reductase-like flavin-dependent oxidoreductase (luciferase family)